MDFNFNTIKENQLELLSTTQSLLNKCFILKLKEVLSIKSSELAVLTKVEFRDKLDQFFSQFETSVIYIVSLDTFRKHEKIQSVFEDYKKKKIHSLSKINHPSKNWSPNGKVLYVGSSRGSNLKTRMKNHFGVGSKTVYSLHLKHWIPEDLETNIIVELFQIERPVNNSSNINLLELIEQGFWDELRPMFGKRSGLL